MKAAFKRRNGTSAEDQLKARRSSVRRSLMENW
jgi:hypothetical protein